MGGSGFDHGRIIWLKRILSSPLFRFSLGFAISCLSLSLALHEVRLSDLQRAFTFSDIRFVGLSLISVAINLLLKVLRWRILLVSSGRKAGFPKVSMSFLAAQMLNAFLPLRAGEISRVYVLGRSGIDHAFVLGTIGIEKILDTFAYALLFILLLLLIPLPEWMSASGITIIISVFCISLMVFFAVFYRNRLMDLLDRVITRLPERYRSFFIHHLRVGLSSLEVLQDRTVMISLATATAFIWSTAILTNHLVFRSLEIDLPATASLLVLLTLQIGISIPSLPGNVGVFEYICILALGVFGVGQAVSLSYGILLHVIVYLPIVILGFLSYWLLNANISKGDIASGF